VVTETSLPDRIGANTERRGSALCLMLNILIRLAGSACISTGFQ